MIVRKRAVALFFSFSVVWATMLRAQDTGAPPAIYAIALVEGAKEMERQWGKQSDSVPGVAREQTNYKRRLVTSDGSVRGDYPRVAGDFQFDFLTYAELHARRKKLGKDFTILCVHPATVEGPRVKVLVSQDWIAIYKKKPAVGVSDWAKVYFLFDAKLGQFRLDEVKLGGI